MTSVAGAVALMLILVGLVTWAGVAQAEDPEAEAEAALVEAQEALNRAEYEEAAVLFERTRERSRERALRDKALYWEAFSRYRLERTEELMVAAELLAQLEEGHRQLELDDMPRAELKLAEESEALAARINGELARRGEYGAARRVHEQAEEENIRMDTRMAAMQALLQMDPERAEPMLEKILRDDSHQNREMRVHAVMMGCQEESPKMQALLVELLETETDPEFLSTIVMCLSMNPTSETMDIFMDMFKKNPGPEVAETLLMAVARQHDEGDQEKVFTFLADIVADGEADVEMRQSALMALSLTDQDERSTDLLVDILKTEEDPELLEAALMSLARQDNAAADEALRNLATQPGRDEEFQAMALHAASIHGHLSVDFLREVYAKASTPDMKLQVCHILTRNPDQDAALDAMLEFARAEKDPEVKQQMVFWVGRFNDPKAADFLLEILNGE